MRTDPSSEASAPVPSPPLPGVLIVGLGAGGGGLSSLQDFFRALSPAQDVVVFIRHHDPAVSPSVLVTALQEVTTLRITAVDAQVALSPQHGYVLASRGRLSLASGTLMVVSGSATDDIAPIDHFFRDLAELWTEQVVAVLLAGEGSDGASGIERVKERGGAVFVQEPTDAPQPSMPRTAIATNLVDVVLPAAVLPAAILRYWRNRPAPPPPQTRAVPSAPDDGTLRTIFSLLQAATGHDFSAYKPATILRRISRRMQVLGIHEQAMYVAHLQTTPAAIQALFRDLLISVTNFYRDLDAWTAITEIIPQLFAGKQSSDQVRVWVAGCATGQEAYSIAMVLADYAATLAAPPAIQVFATDIDADAIDLARIGRYPATIAADVPAPYLQRFFRAEPDAYRISPEIRDLVVFAPHNLLRDPPFSRLDLITCRNVLIYLKREMQDQLLQLFHFILRPQGYLFLGSSESTDSVPGLFGPMDTGHRVFRRQTVPAGVSLFPPALPIGSGRLVAADLRPSAPGAAAEMDIQQLVQQALPPTVLVNAHAEVLHLAAGVGRFLHLNEGSPSHNLLHLVHPQLHIEVRTALVAATQSGTVQTCQGTMPLDGAPHLVHVQIAPLTTPAWAAGLLVVRFTDVGAVRHLPPPTVSSTDLVVQQLDAELQRTKAHLRTTIDQYEAAGQASKYTNEALQAMNEELRAATEELETSKEELQSVNEELTTLNQELKQTVEGLRHLNNDLQNLMTATEIATIFVDRALRVKLYTPSAAAIFNLIPADIHRPLSHMTHQLDYPELLADVARVLQTLTPITREIQRQPEGWYLTRFLPYRTVDDTIDGVILTFVDVTERKQIEFALRGSEERFHLLSASGLIGIASFDLGGTLIQANAAFLHIIRSTPAAMQAQQVTWAKLVSADTPPIDQTMAQFFTVGTMRLHEREYCRADGTRFWGILAGVQVADTQEYVTFLLDTSENVRRQHQREEATYAAFVRRLVAAQEEERQRIARELHDHFGQQLTALMIGLKGLDAEIATPPAQELIAHLRGIVELIGQEAHQLALDLRPTVLDDLGLLPALNSYVEQCQRRTGIMVHVHARGFAETRLESVLETTIYRVVQEALTNVVKHAAATEVSILLHQTPEQVRLIIEDDGQGFDPEAQTVAGHIPRLGLQGIRERVALVGGTVQLETTLTRGTTLFVVIPRPEKDGRHDDAPYPAR